MSGETCLSYLILIPAPQLIVVNYRVKDLRNSWKYRHYVVAATVGAFVLHGEIIFF